MNALDLIFKHYEDFLILSEHFQAQKPILNEMESNFRKKLNKNQLCDFDDLVFLRTDCYERTQKEAFKCGMRVGAQLIIDLMDKDATNVTKLFEQNLSDNKKTQE